MSAKQTQGSMADAIVAALLANPDVMKAILANAKTPKPGTKFDANGRTERQVELEKLIVAAFKRKGLKTDQIKPRINILTFGKWVERGFVVKEGEKAVKVKNLRLFHESQVRPLTDEDRAKFAAREAAKTTTEQPSAAT